MDYKCINGHDKCNEMYPSAECPYCEPTNKITADAVEGAAGGNGMSDIEHVSCEMRGGIAVSVASTTSDPIWAGDLLKAYQALSTIGDPVKVAEALPELVEVAQRLTSRIVHPKTGGRIILEADIEQLETLLAKLKARP